MNNLGRKIKEYLDNNSISKKVFSDSFGVSTNSIDSWINGEKLPTLSRICQIAYYIGVSVGELLNEKNDDTSKMTIYDYRYKREKNAIGKIDKLSKPAIVSIVNSYINEYKEFNRLFKYSFDNNYEEIAKLKELYNELKIKCFKDIGTIIIKDPEFNMDFLTEELKNTIDKSMQFNFILDDSESIDEVKKKLFGEYKIIKDLHGNQIIVIIIRENELGEIGLLKKINDYYLILCNEVGTKDIMNHLIIDDEIRNVMISKDYLMSYIKDISKIISDNDLELFLLEDALNNLDFNFARFDNFASIIKEIKDFEGYIDRKLSGKARTELLYLACQKGIDITDYADIKTFSKSLYEGNKFTDLVL